MSINLLNVAREHLSDHALKLISDKVGINPDNVSEVIGKAFPSLLALFGERAGSSEGAESVFNAVKDADAGILSNLTEAFSGDTAGLQEGGLNTIKTLFGDNLSSITDKIGQFSGISGNKAGGLLGLLTPLLSGMLKNQISANGLGASGLQSLLKGQKEHIAEVLGTGFMDKLGLGSLLAGLGGKACSTTSNIAGKACDTGSKVAGTVGNAGSKVGGAVTGAAAKTGSAVGGTATAVGSGATAAGKTAGGGLLKLIPIILLALLAFLLLKMCKRSEGGNILEKTGSALKDTGGAIVDGAKGAGSAVADGAGALGEGAQALGGAAVEGVKDAGSAVADGAGALGEGAQALGGAAVEGVKDAGSAVADGAGALGKGAQALGGAAVEGVKDAGNAVADGAGALGEGAQALGGAAVEGVKDAGNAVADEMKTEVPVKENSADSPNLSDKVKTFAEKLSSIDASDEQALDNVYKDLSADGSSSFLYRIPFQTGETGVPSAHQSALIAKLKAANPEATLVTIGYADTRGDEGANKRLSFGRAKEVGAWISKTLGNNTGIESFSMGETDRFSKSDFAKNRVVEVWQVTE